MNNIVGVDPASMKSVAVRLNDDGYEIHVHKTKAKDNPTRCLEAFMWMRRVVADLDGPTTVFIELPVAFAGRGGLQAFFPLLQVQGALAAGALSAGATVVQIGPTEWKKAVVGHGHASKLKTKMYLKKHWQAFYLDSEGDIDVCDAGAITLYGRKLAGPTKGMTRASKQLVGSGRSSPRSPVHRRTGVVASPRKGVPALVKDSPRKRSS